MGQSIPGLKESLVKMLCDLRLQVSIQDGCNNILVRDYFNLHDKLTRNQQKALFVSYDHACGMCRNDILVKGKSNPSANPSSSQINSSQRSVSISDSTKTNVVVFNCRHFFHETCLPDNYSIDFCTVCKSKK